MRISFLAMIVGATVGTAQPVVAQQGLPAFDSGRAEAHCAEQWTKRGVMDREMFSYCMDKQRDGHADARDHIERTYSSLDIMAEVVPYAAEKWLTREEYQFDMVAYEIEKQGEAYLNVAYGLQHAEYTEDQVMMCVAQWITPAEPQWDMVEYCLERN